SRRTACRPWPGCARDVSTSSSRTAGRTSRSPGAFIASAWHTASSSTRIASSGESDFRWIGSESEGRDGGGGAEEPGYALLAISGENGSRLARGAGDGAIRRVPRWARRAEKAGIAGQVAAAPGGSRVLEMLPFLTVSGLVPRGEDRRFPSRAGCGA